MKPGDRVKILPLGEDWADWGREAFSGLTGTIEEGPREVAFMGECYLVKLDREVRDRTFRYKRFHFRTYEVEPQ